MKRNMILLLGLLLLIILQSCVPGGGSSTSEDPAGFFMGIWHGWIAPFSLIYGLFKPEVGIYEMYNTGWWYDFGFYVAIIGGFGGFSLFRKKSKDKK